MSDDDRPSHLRLVGENEPAWEDMGYGALPDHLKGQRETWEVLGYSSKQEHEAARRVDHGGEKPVVRVSNGAKLSELYPTAKRWGSPVIVTLAKCARHRVGCQNTVGVTEDGLASLEQFSAMLEKRGESPLDLNGCFFCEACIALRVIAGEMKSAERRSKTTEAIRYLKAADSYAIDKAHDLVKASTTPPPRTSDDVTAAMERLAYLAKVMGSGYVNDLVICLRESRKTPGKAKPRAGDL